MRQLRKQFGWAGWALASVALHAAIGIALWRAHPPLLDDAASKSTRPLEAQLHWLDSRDVRALAPPRPLPSKAQAPTRLRHSPEATGGDAIPSPATAATVKRGDVPLAVAPSLVPGVKFELALPGALAAEEPHGSTVHNHPTERVDEAALAEYTGEVLSRQLASDLRGDVAAAQTAVGTIPFHFRRLETSLRQQVSADAVETSSDPLGQRLGNVILGNAISDQAVDRIAQTPLGRSIQNQSVPLPNVDDQRLRENGLSLLAIAEAMRERASAPLLNTVLELIIDPSGALSNASIVKRSGDARFDESVLHLTRRAIRWLPEDDEARGLGASWWQTRVEYTFAPPEVRIHILEAHRVESLPATEAPF